MNANTIPIVDPMMVRCITPLNHLDIVGGVIVLDEFDAEDVGMFSERLPWDEEVVDCSNRIFEITTNIMVRVLAMTTFKPETFTVFPSRRWRSHRDGEVVFYLPCKEGAPFLYIGNPIRIFSNRDGLTVERNPEFRIKSGPELGY